MILSLTDSVFVVRVEHPEQKAVEDVLLGAELTYPWARAIS